MTDTPKVPDDRQLNEMSRDELVKLGTELDGVEIIYREPRWPVDGTRAEKRAERQVAFWLLLGGFSGLALLLIFLFWPWWEFRGEHDPDNLLYTLTTPLYGVTFGLSILAIGVGAVLFQKKFIPEEIAVQDRHDGNFMVHRHRAQHALRQLYAEDGVNQLENAFRVLFAQHQSQRVFRRRLCGK